MADLEDDAPAEPITVRARAMAHELWAAVRYLFCGRSASLDLEEVARGGAFFPVLGLAIGSIAWVIVWSLGPVLGSSSVPLLAVVGLAVASGAALPRGLAGAAALACSGRVAIESGEPSHAGRVLGLLAALLTTSVKVWAVSVTPAAALSLSLPLAAMLGRWAFVVQAYGSQSAGGDGVGAAFPRAMQFREFGLASVSAMALTLILANAIGLVLILWTATQTILVRVLSHSRAGGVGERGLAAGAELAETSTLLLCAGLARAILSG